MIFKQYREGLMSNLVLLAAVENSIIQFYAHFAADVATVSTTARSFIGLDLMLS